ncbi:hypothetical protein QOV31_004536 [Agrobacterium fabrum]|nr:hypothetical protein QOV31_004536 [Agrobacterium fabrum]CAD0214654.1 hypothetical protein AGTUEHA105_LOCUS4600 [Agrobacterium tumefaciens]
MEAEDSTCDPDLAKDAATALVVAGDMQHASVFMPLQQDARLSCRSLRRYGGARSRQDRLDHPVHCCRRSYRPVSNSLTIGIISHDNWKSTPRRSKGLRYKVAMRMPACLFVTLPSDWIEHLPELRIGKIGKLFSKNWSLPGQEQQLSVRRQIAHFIRGE